MSENGKSASPGSQGSVVIIYSMCFGLGNFVGPDNRLLFKESNRKSLINFHRMSLMTCAVRPYLWAKGAWLLCYELVVFSCPASSSTLLGFAKSEQPNRYVFPSNPRPLRSPCVPAPTALYDSHFFIPHMKGTFFPSISPRNSVFIYELGYRMEVEVGFDEKYKETET